jgi:senataxin
MKYLKVNRPQAEAIIAADLQSSGFVLIEGPPGTGKTSTIVGLVIYHNPRLVRCRKIQPR